MRHFVSEPHRFIVLSSNHPLLMSSIRLLILLFCCFIVTVGCSKDSRLSVSGNVVFDGIPIKEGSIAFMPVGQEGGSGGSGLITDGKYDVLVSQGKMMVQIYAERDPTPQEIQERERNPMGSSSMMPGSAPLKVQFIPEKYNTVSTLRADIQKTEKNLDFTLTSSE